jgi:peptidyl-prolyl cis-trans isomerase B (cyclophilin B)
MAPTEEPVATSKNQDREAREARDRLKAYNARQAVHSHQVKRNRRDNILAVAGVVVVAALATTTNIFFFTAGPGMPTPAPSSSSSAAAGENVGAVPDPSVSEYRTWTGELTINGIPMSIELDGAAAPQAVASFVTDAQNGYYTDKTCHRLVENDAAGLLQCGSEDGVGGTSTDYAFGPIENAPADNKYVTGVLAIARSGSAYGNGHQFFLVFKDTILPTDAAGGYTVIGKVTTGLDQLVTGVVSKGFTPGSSTSEGAPVVPTTITRVTVE